MFTRDICRLLGFGGDGPGEEEMEIQSDAPGRTDKGKDKSSAQQAMLSGEEGLGEDKRTRQRAERRRAKKKRQKERKKLEKEERMEDSPEQQGEEEAGGVSDSDSEEEVKAETASAEVHPRIKHAPDSAPAGNKSRSQMLHRSSEEEPEWDVSSAFVANAASHIKAKGLKTRAQQISRENKENESRSSQMENSNPAKQRGESLTAQGIQMFEQGQYSQAVEMFTAAIICDPKDHRVFGNRSYCYWCLEQYYSALTDAQRSIELAPDWPKGYFRKGCALMGLKQYSEAQTAMEQVLKLDEQCEAAASELFNCRVLQLTELGFEEEQSILLLEKFTSVQAVLASTDADRALKQQEQNWNCRSLWVGNITFEVTEKHILDLFKT
ncbi:hypothetical protein LDENG_00118890 [Lucifuga dentata]|nr:hypothetical protein LDENG_00118890 [Lucifuga dentata]